MMEVSSQFRQIFKVMDSNGDGKLSSSELGEVLICLGCDKSNATKEAEGMLKQMDYNGDGFIDVDEFMDAVHDDSDGKPKEDYLMDAFLIFYIDRNGLISAMELRRVLINLGCDKCTLEDCRRMNKTISFNAISLICPHSFPNACLFSAGKVKLSKCLPLCTIVLFNVQSTS